MVSLSQLQEDRARAKAGMDRSNVIVNPEFLRKELMKVYYVKDVDIIMNIIGPCHMKKLEPKQGKPNKDGIISPDGDIKIGLNKDIEY